MGRSIICCQTLNLPRCGSVYHASGSPIPRVDADVVSLICMGLEVDTGGGGKGVQTALDD